MKSVKPLISACRYCRYYQPEGRRGGKCKMLEVSVQGTWKACALAIPTFASAWEGLEEVLLEQPPILTPCYTLVSGLNFAGLDSSEQAVGHAPEYRKAEPSLV